MTDEQVKPVVEIVETLVTYQEQRVRVVKGIADAGRYRVSARINDYSSMPLFYDDYEEAIASAMGIARELDKLQGRIDALVSERDRLFVDSDS